MEKHRLLTNTTQPVRTIAACYFTVLSIIATSMIQLMLFLLGMSDLVPIFMSFLLAIPIAWLSGLIFGLKIISSKKKLALFFVGYVINLIRSARL